MRKHSAILYLLLLPILLLLGLLCTVFFAAYLSESIVTPTPVYQDDLIKVVQDYLDTVYEAQLTMDTTQLSDAMTGELLISHTNIINKYQDNPNGIVLEETNILAGEIISYMETNAVIEIKYEYRQFVRDIETGERDYGPSTARKWRIVRFTLIYDEDRWKVSDLDFVNWGYR